MKSISFINTDLRQEQMNRKIPDLHSICAKEISRLIPTERLCEIGGQTKVWVLYSLERGFCEVFSTKERAETAMKSQIEREGTSLEILEYLLDQSLPLDVVYFIEERSDMAIYAFLLSPFLSNNKENVEKIAKILTVQTNSRRNARPWTMPFCSYDIYSLKVDGGGRRIPLG
jgi:hypothetical protein